MTTIANQNRNADPNGDGHGDSQPDKGARECSEADHARG